MKDLLVNKSQHSDAFLDFFEFAYDVDTEKFPMTFKDISEKYPTIWDDIDKWEVIDLMEICQYLIGDSEITSEELVSRLNKKLIVLELYETGGMIPIIFEGKDEYGREIFIRIRWDILTVDLNDSRLYSCDFDMHRGSSEIENEIYERLESIGFDIRELVCE